MKVEETKMKGEYENVIIAFPEQGGDVVNVRLKEAKVDLAVGGTSYGSIQVLVYHDDEVVATLEVKKMDPEEAPDVEEPYLVSIYDGDPSAKPDDEVVVNGQYN